MAKSKFEQNSTNAFFVHTKETGGYFKTEIQSQSTRFCPLKWWTYCGYYSLVVPFRPTTNDNGGCTLETNMFQRVCRIGILALTGISLTISVIENVTKFKQTTKLTAKSYFELTFRVLGLVGTLNFHWILSKKRRDIEDLMVGVGKNSGFKTAQKWPRGKLVGFAYLFLVVLSKLLLSCSYIIVRFNILSGSFNQSILVGKKNFAVFLKNSSLTNTTTYGSTDISLGVTSIMIELAYVCNRYFLATFFAGLLPITFWLAAKEFHTFISNIESNAELKGIVRRQKHILEEYDRLKRLTDSINSIWGGIYFAWIMEKSLNLMLVNDAVSSRILWSIVYFVSQSVFPAISFILLADGCRITRNFREWMSSPNVKKSYFIDAGEWEGLMREIDVDPISVGATGLYKITYGFLGQLIAVVITLFTISFD